MLCDHTWYVLGKIVVKLLILGCMSQRDAEEAIVPEHPASQQEPAPLRLISIPESCVTRQIQSHEGRRCCRGYRQPPRTNGDRGTREYHHIQLKYTSTGLLHLSEISRSPL